MTGRIIVIYNPTAGRGRAAGMEGELRRRLPAGAELQATSTSGEAVALAAEAIRVGADWIVAAGGDGTVHEVANGILNAGGSRVQLLPLPLGSMNDYAFTLGLVDWWRRERPWSELRIMAVDVGTIEGAGRHRHFVNCCGIGFNGMVTTEARKIRRLRGVPLYALAVICAMVRHFRTPRLRITIDGLSHEQETLALTIGIGPREGGFALTADARLNDGLFDTLQVGDVSRWELIRHLPAMIAGRLPRNHPKLTFGKARVIEVMSSLPLCIHGDGEFFAEPNDRICQVRTEIQPECLRVACLPGEFRSRGN